MRPEFLDSLSWEIAEVYGAIEDQILVNLAHYFPYFTKETVPKSAFTYQARMLAQIGQVNEETLRIISENLKGVDFVLRDSLEVAIMDTIRKTEPELYKGALMGMVQAPKTVPIATNQMRAFQLYYKQSADKLNLVNTVMLESTKQAYQSTVSDIVAQIGVKGAQTALNIGAGEVITGVSSWNTAMIHSINRMKQSGITGFVDHAGRHWSAEAYVSMDIRTTMANTARAAMWETNESFGNDLYQVSYHDGARPLCYPWQNKVISATNNARETVDLDGNQIHVYAQSETSYGEAAGLFGINCKHYPTPFIPGVSIIRGTPQDEEANAKTYAESQEQRRLERKIREEKRDLAMLKAQNAPEEAIKTQRAKVRQTSDDIDTFCEETGRARRQNREGVYTKRSFPAKDSYDVTEFTREQKERFDAYWKNGGAQQGFTFGQMTPNAPAQPPPVNVQTSDVPQTAERNQIGIDPQTIGQYPYKPSELPSTPGSLNVYGERIKFSEIMDKGKWQSAKDTIEQLSTEFKSRLREVKTGQGTIKKARSAGAVDSVTGTIMHLSSTKIDVVIHEFAHTISTTDATKYKFANDEDFWKEIRNVRTQYRKAVRKNWEMMISTYADSEQSIDEFMAEAFSLGYMHERGIPVPDNYGNDTEFSSKVLSIVRKYFLK